MKDYVNRAYIHEIGSNSTEIEPIFIQTEIAMKG